MRQMSANTLSRSKAAPVIRLFWKHTTGKWRWWRTRCLGQTEIPLQNPAQRVSVAYAHCILVLFNKIVRNAYKFVRIISAVYWKFTSAVHIKSGTNLPRVGHRYMHARQCDFLPIMEIQILEQT